VWGLLDRPFFPTRNIPGAGRRDFRRRQGDQPVAMKSQQTGEISQDFRLPVHESAFIPFVSFGDLDDNTFKGLTSLLSVEQEIQYDEHT
jgi:hypothetical protein